MSVLVIFTSVIKTRKEIVETVEIAEIIETTRASENSDVDKNGEYSRNLTWVLHI